MTKPSIRIVRISSIRCNKRRHRDLGDINDLVQSIQEIGLLHPVIIDPDNRLIVGYRRKEAFLKLGKRTIPTITAHSLDDALLRLKAERDENTCRKDLTPTEAVAIGRELESLERKAARDRQSAGGRIGGQGGGKLPQASQGKTRDKVAASLGMSGRTYEKAKKVVQEAKKDPTRLGDLPATMDRTNIDRAHRELHKRQETQIKRRRKEPRPTIEAQIKGRRYLQSGHVAEVFELLRKLKVTELHALAAKVTWCGSKRLRGFGKLLHEHEEERHQAIPKRGWRQDSDGKARQVSPGLTAG